MSRTKTSLIELGSLRRVNSRKLKSCLGFSVFYSFNNKSGAEISLPPCLFPRYLKAGLFKRPLGRNKELTE